MLNLVHQSLPQQLPPQQPLPAMTFSFSHWQFPLQLSSRPHAQPPSRPHAQPPSRPHAQPPSRPHAHASAFWIAF